MRQARRPRTGPAAGGCSVRGPCGARQSGHAGGHRPAPGRQRRRAVYGWRTRSPCEAAGVQDVRPVNDDRIVQATAPRQSGGMKLLDLRGLGKGAGRGDLMPEGCPASDAETLTGGRSRWQGSRSTSPFPGSAAPLGTRAQRPQFRPGFTGGDPNRTAKFNHTACARPARPTRRNPAGTRTARRSHPESGFRARRPRSRRCR